MRRLRPREKARIGEFRLLRGVPFEVNFTRFVKHMQRLRRRLSGDFVIRKFRVKNRRRARAAAAACRRA